MFSGAGRFAVSPGLGLVKMALGGGQVVGAVLAGSRD